MHAPSKEKNDDSKDRFYEELGQVSIIFLSNIYNFLYVFIQNWEEIIFSNRKIGKMSLYQDSSNNGVK
jgi:hypothetical protein